MIDNFRGEYYFLSNFSACEPPVYYESMVYPTSEHAYQAAKTLNKKVRIAFADPDLTPAQAKRMGQTVEIRKDWENVKISVMEEIVRNKFSDPVRAKLLLDTGDAELVEGNTWNDRFWGVCRGKGENHLGKILMKIRSEIRNNTRPHRWKLSWPGNFCLDCGMDDPIETAEWVPCPQKHKEGDDIQSCNECGGYGAVPEVVSVPPCPGQPG